MPYNSWQLDFKKTLNTKMKEFNRLQGVEGRKNVSFSAQGQESWVDLIVIDPGGATLRKKVMEAHEATGVDPEAIYATLRDGNSFDWPNQK